MGSPVKTIGPNPKQNILINGWFDYWQRNTTGSGQGDAYVAADRWMVDGLDFSVPAGVNTTMTRLTDSTIPVLDGNYRYVARLSTAVATMNRMSIGQKIEDIFMRPFVGKKVTLTFYVKRVGSASINNNGRIISTLLPASGTSTWSNLLRDSFEAVGELSPLNVTHTTNYNGLSNTTWTKYSRTFEVTTGMALGLMVAIHVNCSASYVPANGAANRLSTGDHIDIGGITLTEGEDPATEVILAGRNLPDEVSLCQRYFLATTVTGTGLAQRYIYEYPTRMRSGSGVISEVGGDLAVISTIATQSDLSFTANLSANNNSVSVTVNAEL